MVLVGEVSDKTSGFAVNLFSEYHTKPYFQGRMSKSELSEIREYCRMHYSETLEKVNECDKAE